MSWRCNERCDARTTYRSEERPAFRAGYSDGWYGYPMWASNERDHFPNAYSAGYHEGAADRREEQR